MLSKRPRLDAPSCSDEDESSHVSSAAGTNSFDTLRKDRVLSDISLFAEDEDEEFHVHKVVLASHSDYFKTMFTSGMAEQEKDRVTLKGVKADQLRAILEFMYTRTIGITDSNVESILSAADYLQVATVKDRCCRFLKERLNATNCLSISQIAEDRACPDLKGEAMSCAYNSFDQVMRHKEFLELPAGRLIEFLSSDEITVKKEEDLFEAVMSWLNRRPEERTQGFEKILEHIRLPLMNPYYLLRAVEKTPAVTQNEKCRELLVYAKHLHLFPDIRRECGLAVTTPRKNSLMVQAAIFIGHRNGAPWFHDMDCFVPSRDTWLSYKIPFPSCSFAVAAIEQNSLLLAGGPQDIGCAAHRFDPALDSWSKAAPMTSKKGRVSLAAVDGFVYAVVATRGEQVRVERYDPVVNQWDPVKEMEIEFLPSPVATSQGGRLLVSSVFKEGDDTKGCIQSYDPYTDRWEVLSSSLPSLDESSSCVYNKKLYFVGGWDEAKKESSRSVICFDPETTTWSACEPMEEGRASPAVAVIAGKMFVFGGSKHVEKQLGMDTMEVYDLETNRWLGKKTMERNTWWTGCVVLNIPARWLERFWTQA